jgi:hypothetical protein
VRDEVIQIIGIESNVPPAELCDRRYVGVTGEACIRKKESAP